MEQDCECQRNSHQEDSATGASKGELGMGRKGGGANISPSPPPPPRVCIDLLGKGDLGCLVIRGDMLIADLCQHRRAGSLDRGMVHITLHDK